MQLKKNTRLYIGFLGLIFIAIGLLYLRSQGSGEVFSSHSFLAAPSGPYGVGFKDFQWADPARPCPDPAFNGKNFTDFSPDNLSHCHEIALRVYYPTGTRSAAINPVYKPLMEAWVQSLQVVTGVTEDQLAEVRSIRSYAAKEAPLKEGTYPVILFSPGYGFQVQVYEGIIADLVSHGYIVVGINSMFINGDIALLNGHVVKQDMTANADVPALIHSQGADLAFIFNKIHSAHGSESLFNAMDLAHLGLLGHASGGAAMLDVLRENETHFQAAAGLVMTGDTRFNLKSHQIPFMTQISADWELPSIELANHNFLVRLAPDLFDHRYSHNLSFTDYSTLRTLQAYQAKAKYDSGEIFSVHFFGHQPTAVEAMDFGKHALIFLKEADRWRLLYYTDEKFTQEITIGSIAGLESALSHLPEKAPEALTLLDAESIRKVITQANAAFTNTADGTEILTSVNAYLVAFFDSFLKQQSNPNLANCQPLNKHSTLQCGPAQDKITVRIK